MTLPVVAVVGRPNVGKSTLVNRILGRREAIVQELPGVTRDRVLYEAEWLDRAFLLVDTGGLEANPEGPLAGKVAEAARAAAAEADVVLMVVDVTAGVTADDIDVAEEIRRLGHRTVVAVNKVDNQTREQDAAEFFRLGLGEPHGVSALHGRSIGDLLDTVTEGFEPLEPEAGTEPAIAIVGRPNVGKSTLFNRLVGQERSIVHDEAGTTRDAVDTVVDLDGEVFRFVDTAGLRRTTRIDDSTEYYGLVRTIRAIERCDVALLVIDADEGITRQDLRLAEQLMEAGRSAVIVLNKTDVMSSDFAAIEEAEVRRRLPYLDFAPLVRVSALEGTGVKKIMPLVRRILVQRAIRIPTPVLNAVVDDVQARTPIPSSGKGARVKYAVQAETSPPVIVLFGAGRIPDRWLRHLDRQVRARFGFEGTPIRFVLKGPAPRRGVAGRRSGGKGRRGRGKERS